MWRRGAASLPFYPQLADAEPCVARRARLAIASHLAIAVDVPMREPSPVFAWGSVSEELALFKALNPEQRFKISSAMVRLTAIRPSPPFPLTVQQ